SDAAINEVSTQIANPYFDQFTVVWAQNLKTSNEAMVEGLEELAKQIDRALVLRDKRIAAVSLPVGSYKLVGLIIVGLIGATMALLGDIVVGFYTSPFGQVATLCAV